MSPKSRTREDEKTLIVDVEKRIVPESAIGGMHFSKTPAPRPEDRNVSNRAPNGEFAIDAKRELQRRRTWPVVVR